MNRMSMQMLTMSARIVVVVMMFVPPALALQSAGTVAKSFEFGPGTAQSNSHTRAFSFPCGWNVDASVVYRRDYDAVKTVTESLNDVPIKIELREPDISPEQYGPLIATKMATAKGFDQTVEFDSTSRAVNRGCNLAWRVTVRHANDSPPPRRVSGTITLQMITRRFFGSSLGTLRPGESVTVDARFEGLGLYTFMGGWKSWMLIPSPIRPVTKLKFELIDPGGVVVASDDGFPHDTTNICCSGNKVAIAYNFTACGKVGAAWKLRITNVDVNIASDIYPRRIVTNNSCPI